MQEAGVIQNNQTKEDMMSEASRKSNKARNCDEMHDNHEAEDVMIIRTE